MLRIFHAVLAHLSSLACTLSGAFLVRKGGSESGSDLPRITQRMDGRPRPRGVSLRRLLPQSAHGDFWNGPKSWPASVFLSGLGELLLCPVLSVCSPLPASVKGFQRGQARPPLALWEPSSEQTFPSGPCRSPVPPAGSLEPQSWGEEQGGLAGAVTPLGGGVWIKLQACRISPNPD